MLLFSIESQYTVKKVSHFPVPSRDVTYQTLPGREKLFPASESLVSEYPGWGREYGLPFFTV